MPSKNLLLIFAFWAVMWIYFGYASLLGLVALTADGTLLAIFLISKGLHLLDRKIWIEMGFLVVTIGCFLVDEAGNVSFLFASTVGGTFITYRLRYERFWIALFISMTLELRTLH